MLQNRYDGRDKWGHRDWQADWLRGLPGWRVASLSSEPPQCEWATTGLAPTLPPQRLTACKGNTGRARVKGRVRDRAEQKPQPQNQGEIMDGQKGRKESGENRQQRGAVTGSDKKGFFGREHLLSVPEQSLADSIFSLEEGKRLSTQSWTHTRACDVWWKM